MNLASKELRAALSGEYLLGNMSPRARRRFEQLMLRHPQLRAELEIWRQRLRLLSTPEAVPAPAAVWRRIDEDLDRADSRVRLIRSAPRPRTARLWQAWSALATAASVVLAVLVIRGPQPMPDLRAGPQLAGLEAAVSSGQQNPNRGQVLAASHSPQQPYRGLMGHVSLPNETARWRVSVDMETRTLQVESIGASALHIEEDYQLWWISDDEIVSIGLLPRNGGWQMVLPRHLHLQDFSRMAVTREPAFGSPAIDGPTGPVLMQAALDRWR